MPYMITAGNKIYRLQKDGDAEEKCYHEEADTRLVLIAFEEQTDVVIVAKDTDFLVLLVWAYSFYNVKYKWYFKYDRISVICDYVGRDLCLTLPAFHSLTGCDTTSYFFRTGKLRAFKKVLADPTKLTLLASLDKERFLTENNIKDVRDFVRKVVYTGKDDEEYVDTRVRLYKHLSCKSSMPLLPDPDSLVQVIKRAHFQTFEWLRCCEPVINHLNLQDCGWEIKDDEVKPVWYTGSQMLPSVQRKRAREKIDGSIADDEISDTECLPKTKKSRKTAPQRGKKKGSSRKTVKSSRIAVPDVQKKEAVPDGAPMCTDETLQSGNEVEQARVMKMTGRCPIFCLVIF